MMASGMELQWDWENMALVNGRISEMPKQVRSSEWGIDSGSVYSSAAAAAGGGCSDSDLGIVCSSKSSISASFDSTSKVGDKKSGINFEAIEGFPKNINKKKEVARVEDSGTSPEFVASVGSREPLIGLKLGKRTYFEDACAGSNMKDSSVTAISSTSNTSVKKSRTSHQTMQSFRCQVEGCNVDLTAAKDYHRKHRVCESHSKCPKVIVAGQERRFCQQCSRFHDMSEFDQKKRSCRRRLSDHNARRRKPHPVTISFNSARLSSSSYDNRQQMSPLLNKVPLGHMRPTASLTWEDACDFKLTQTKGSWIRSTKAGGIGGQLHFPSNELSNDVSSLHHDLDTLLPFKGTTAEVHNQGLEASMIASNLDGAPDLRCALSLLSTNSWGSADLRPTTSLSQFVDENYTSGTQPSMQVLQPSTDYWQSEQSLAQETRLLPYSLHGNTSEFQQLQPFKAPYGTVSVNSNQIR